MFRDDWQLHPQLAKDCHLLGQLGSVHLLLHRNAALHWFILVPETDALDLLDLPPGPRESLLQNAAQVAEFLKTALNYSRVNVGALGLLVPQLHLHVVGRREDDPCWPQPVWGNLGGEARYSDHEILELRSRLLQ
jgi:diadenosine tetraphosphate (Ap4A) HIT family hydrolase